MTVLCVSNSPRTQQMALSEIQCKRARHFYTERQDNFIKDHVAPSIARLDISRFLSLGLPEEDIVQE